MKKELHITDRAVKKFIEYLIEQEKSQSPAQSPIVSNGFAHVAAQSSEAQGKSMLFAATATSDLLKHNLHRAGGIAPAAYSFQSVKITKSKIDNNKL